MTRATCEKRKSDPVRRETGPDGEQTAFLLHSRRTFLYLKPLDETPPARRVMAIKNNARQLDAVIFTWSFNYT